MTRMKDSGIEWIGEVPEEWGITKFKFLGTAKNGLTYSPENIVEQTEGVLVLRSGNIRNNKLVFDNNVYVNSQIEPSIFLKKGDILITARNGSANLIGKNAIVEEPILATYGAFMMVFRVNKRMKSKFAYYLMNSSFDFYRNFFTTSTVNQLTAGIFYNIEVPLPTIIEQTKIADFLDKKIAQLDKVKSLLEEQIKTLEGYRQSLIYETVTKGLDKTVPLKDSGVDWIGQIPEGWGVGKLKYYFDVQLGKMLQPSAINGNDIEIDYLRAINVQWDNISVDNLSKMWCNPSEVSKYEIINGDLLVCEGGEVGRCGIVEYLSDRAIIQNAVHRIRSAERANVRFLNYYIQHTTKSKWFDILCNKATIAHLTSEKLLNTLVVLPSISEQIRLADFLDKKTEQINQMIAIKKEQIENINKQRQTLIYDYVTGKRRV
ncbi:TPA: restriction endonuclease subunit S [Streptococcus suis]